jgi:hypothetical protein
MRDVTVIQLSITSDAACPSGPARRYDESLTLPVLSVCASQPSVFTGTREYRAT